MGHGRNRIPTKLHQVPTANMNNQKSSSKSSHSYEIGACVLVALCGFLIYRERGMSADSVPVWKAEATPNDSNTVDVSMAIIYTKNTYTNNGYQKL